MQDIVIEIEKQISNLGKEIQNVVERFASPEEEGFSPKTDLVEGVDAIHIYMDLPGLGKKDIKITVKGEQMTVTGHREVSYENVDVKKQERNSGQFFRSFSLHEGVDYNKVQAKFSQGVLHIRLPKSESGNSQEIDIE